MWHAQKVVWSKTNQILHEKKCSESIFILMKFIIIITLIIHKFQENDGMIKLSEQYKLHTKLRKR